MDFKSIIIDWYNSNKRDLPWRKTTDPYRIWVSEVILQQTRVAQGVGYYHRFIEAFPDIFHLALAEEDTVMKLWQGLGYYTRARNLQKGAKHVVENYSGKLPSTYNELITIPGIGPYSAGAIASFAFKQVVPAIDGNVYRVIARIFGVFSSPFTSRGKKDFTEIVTELIDINRPDVFNQSLLDFGALQCIPKGPKCDLCPFAEYCYAFRNNLVLSLPVRAKKIATRQRYFVYIMVKRGSLTLISKRKGKDIWHSLYEFPMIETDAPPSVEQVHLNPKWQLLFKGINTTIKHISPELKHVLSHQVLYARFIVVEVDRFSEFLMNEYMVVNINEIHTYSTPVLIESYLAAEPAAKYFLNPPA
jgi:A/G-specific adenine glycosylase